jgi:uncharacterized protein
VSLEGFAMRIAMTGADSLLGTAIAERYRAQGHEIVTITSSAPTSPDQVQWEPDAGHIDAAPLEGIDLMIHLAGENVASGPWTEARKREIRDSRVKGTRLLSSALAKLKHPPKTYAAASAIGYYGDTAGRTVDETAPPGENWLAQVVKDWEDATDPARQRGIRVINLRFGIVLSPAQGSLAMLMLPFRVGAGGPLGSGEHFWSWITIDDAAEATLHCVKTPTLHGPVNIVTPFPLLNRQFAETLGQVLNRPTRLGVPAPVARLVVGDMADELLLISIRVQPAKLMQTRFHFKYPQLENALRHLLPAA